MSAGRLSTHILDLTTGRPAAGVRIDLVRLDPGAGPEGRDEERQPITSAQTNADGRTDQPILSGLGMTRARSSWSSTSATTSPYPPPNASSTACRSASRSTTKTPIITSRS